jgi:two-component system sensor histidine kinase KdpD
MGKEDRPDPEELLERYGFVPKNGHGGRGRLRILLGSAPGVGKTYAMLREGRRLREQGRDVVAGYVETHFRPETEQQIGDLEVVPRLQVTYQGKTLEEMDAAAIVARRPEIALIDELAHTNVPGSPREKRYEDVEEILEAGIDVISTLNIQHLESLNDIVESITGVRVRETIPDRILDEADEVQLVDLPVEALLERLEQGKVYPPERARQALQHFFRAGNLTALRELALRTTAAGVEDRLTHYMREHRIEEVWPATERVIALIEADGTAGLVLRNAWRLASAYRGELVALAVLPPDGEAELRQDHRAEMRRARELAEDLGAQIRVEQCQDVAEAIVRVLREENAGLLVMGYLPPAGVRRLVSRGLVDRILDQVTNVDIYLVEKPRS